MRNSTEDIRGIFLREFVKSVALNYPLPKEVKHKHHKEKHDSEKIEKSKSENKPEIKKPVNPKPQVRQPQVQKQAPPIKRIPMRLMRPFNNLSQQRPSLQNFSNVKRNQDGQGYSQSMMNPGSQNKVSFAPPKMSIPQESKQITPQEENSIFGKLSNFLRDPQVQSIECRGPGKNVLINKSGRVETTPVTLGKEDIDGVIGRISKETKIPVIPGVFKALIGGFSITAVVSDYVGTRFIIQKRNPYQTNHP